MSHATHNLDPLERHGAELESIVRSGEDGFGEVLANLVLVDIDGSGKLDIGNVITAQSYMHQTGYKIGVLGILVILHSLDKR